MVTILTVQLALASNEGHVGAEIMVSEDGNNIYYSAGIGLIRDMLVRRLWCRRMVTLLTFQLALASNEGHVGAEIMVSEDGNNINCSAGTGL
jgi:hypothetical protein